MSLLRLAFRMLARDLRAGELHLLLVAMVIAVASLTGVGFFTDRAEQALGREANQLLGGDLLLVADHRWPDEIADAARAMGLRVTDSSQFTSMASAHERAQLAGVKAVGAEYPLRGALRLAPALNAPDRELRHGPPPGEAWVDERLAAALGVSAGEDISLGNARLRVGGVLTYESDRGANFFSFVPRLMIASADLPATGLIQTGSRVTWRLHVAGEADAVARFRAWVSPRLARGEQLEDIANARPEVRQALERAQKFLRLAALLAVVLAAVAIGLGARRYLQRHLDACAVMRCLGAREGQLLGLFGIEFALFGVAAAALGVALGFGVQQIVAGWLEPLTFGTLPAPGWQPVGQGFAVGLVLLLGFVAPQLLRLAGVPTLRVLRREFALVRGFSAGAWVAGGAALIGLMYWIARDVALTAWIAGGFAAAFALYALAARALFALLGRAARGTAGWRYGLVSLRRRAASSLVQAVALGIGLTAVLLLTVTRSELLDHWRASVPADAPNRFVINIQPDQVEPLRALFAAQGLAPPQIYPMIRGRLVSVNGAPIKPQAYGDGRAQRLVEREFNLSYMSRLPPGNELVAGRWYDDGQAAFSVEQGLAETLGLALGDRLGFEVAGQPVEARVTSLRKLDWDSMQVNFFVIAPPAVLAEFPASHITAFHLPAARAEFVNAVVAQFPNLTVIDVAAILRQVQSITERVALAVQAIFLFALAAGVLVLLAALQSTHDERAYELAVMRTVGGREAQLRAALAAEFAALGAVAGLCGAGGAAGVGYALGRYVFTLPYYPGAELLLIGLAAGLAGTLAAGLLATRSLLRKPVLPGLRAAL